MSWLIILLIVLLVIVSVIAAFGLWFMNEFAKGMEQAFGWGPVKKRRWWRR